ncbi:MAG: hypothetical protein ACRD6N_05030, partial [Pyrinomonadaceae bacterium]
ARRTEGLGFPGKTQVSNRIGDIFSSLDSTNAAPTPFLRRYLEEVEPEFRARMDEMNKFLRDTVPQWNQKLQGWNMPTLTTRKPIDF